MDIETITKTLQHVIDEVLPNSKHNITSLELTQSKCDDEYVLNFMLVLKTENEKNVGF